MSGLKVVPALYNHAGNNARYPLLLTDGSQRSQAASAPAESSQAVVPVPTALQYATNQQAYIQAQILSSELYRTDRRHSASRSPREVARAYGQARRRPQAVADMPIQRSVI